MPFADDNDLVLTYHHRMLESLRLREHEQRVSIQSTSASKSTAPVLIPGPLDILMGRGRHPKTCTGALRLHNLMLQRKLEYDTASKLSKTAITEDILKELKTSGCRFLKFAPHGFVEADDAEARKKISQGFRNMRMIRKRHETPEKYKSSARKRNLS